MSNPTHKTDAIQPLPKGLVKVGEPIKHPIYDQQGKLLLQVGTVVSSDSQLEKLYARGLYLNLSQEEFTAERTPTQDRDHQEIAEKKSSERPESGKLTDLSLNGIKIGESLQITPLSDESASTRYLIKYLGGLDKKSLICTLPEVDERTVYIKEHSGYKVQLFSGKDVFSFTTIVEAVYNRPYPHMHLKFPRDVYSKNLRKNQRITANIITSLLNKTPGDEENKKTAGRIVDLSLGGTMIESMKLAGKINDELECSFKITLEDDEAFLVIPSILRNVTEATDLKGQPLFKHGLQFKEILFQDRIILQSYIFQSITGKKLDDL